jgi:protein-S-isoprenylcysteine O-methyltransferase Ste14
MRLAPWIELLVYWLVWAYPFIFRAPHGQKRASIAASTPTLIGLSLEVLAIFGAFVFRLPAGSPPGMARVAASLIFGLIGVVLAWTAVQHLGRQFRICAGLWEDHELVRSGPYAVVRHPIYASLLAMLLCTLLLLTPWQWVLVSLAVFLVGTEIRVRTEDRLLASRFPEVFGDYRRKVPAYLPLVR